MKIGPSNKAYQPAHPAARLISDICRCFKISLIISLIFVWFAKAINERGGNIINIEGLHLPKPNLVYLAVCERLEKQIHCIFAYGAFVIFNNVRAGCTGSFLKYYLGMFLL